MKHRVLVIILFLTIMISAVITGHFYSEYKHEKNKQKQSETLVETLSKEIENTKQKIADYDYKINELSDSNTSIKQLLIWEHRIEQIKKLLP